MNPDSPSEKVYEFIINKIKTQEWLPDARIMTEHKLCEELDVSRSAAREAIGKLETLGLLNKRQGSGTYISNIESTTLMSSLMPLYLLEKKNILELLEFRIYFEYSNIRMFLKNCDKEDIKELEYFYQKMKKNTNNYKEFYMADFQFHSVIANGTKNTIVIKINEILMEVLKQHQSILYKNIGPDIGMEFHKRIIEAIKDKDVELASLLMKRHIEAAIEKYKMILN